MISAAMVKELRERTGAGMMECKKALTETEGDLEKAIDYLREKGLAAAAKKSGRIAAEGLIGTYITEDAKVGAIVEVNCETDFVAKNEDFISFVNGLAKLVATNGAASVEALLEMPYEGSATVKDTLTGLIAKIGENMNVRRFERFAVDNGFVVDYIHGAGRIGTLVAFNAAKKDDKLAEIAKDVAMQIAALKAEYVSSESVPADMVEKEKEILRAQVINEGKKPEFADKIVLGRIGKFFERVCLLEQPFMRDDKVTVGQWIKNEAANTDPSFAVINFARFEKGEGLEKRNDDFAAEVANAAKL